ncbi:MAG: MATE family efflux transporter [Bacilli bacterium]
MNENKMATKKISSLIWSMGLPMIFSMVLQALYNVVDTVFVINMGESGVKANLALTYVFPVQILMIAIGVGTGIGINALLSRSLGNGDKNTASKCVGNGIFIAICFYVVFLLIGLFGSRWFLSINTVDEEVIKMGSNYMCIVCSLSLGALGFNVFERFLQAIGKTMHSTIAQVAGALTNIILDYVFIYPCNMGIEGAAYATVTGQFVSLFIAMAFHYGINKEIKNNIKDIIPSLNIIKQIYKIGWSAMLMQALLSINMFLVIMIISINKTSGELISGTYGIYYKIQQIALFSCFGLSNTIISILSFNIGLNDKKRIKETIKWGIIDALIIALAITLIFEIFAEGIASLFALSSVSDNVSEIKSMTTYAIRIASIGYVFMGFSLAVQGVLQAYRKAFSPLIISLLRLVVFVAPCCVIFVSLSNASSLIWWSFPIAELLTAVVSFFLLFHLIKKENKVQIN